MTFDLNKFVVENLLSETKIMNDFSQRIRRRLRLDSKSLMQISCQDITGSQMNLNPLPKVAFFL